MYQKNCWYVPIATRKRYGLNNLNFPCYWAYTIPLPLRVPVKLDAKKNKKKSKTRKIQKNVQTSHLPKTILDPLTPQDIDEINKSLKKTLLLASKVLPLKLFEFEGIRKKNS